VIDASERTTALAIIDAWNDQSKWASNPWANRDIFHVVTVHEATAAFTANSAREMIASPTIAVFADGNEDIATGYLRAAGIPQSNGAEFLAGKCGAVTCGPGTGNPDMLTEEQIAGDLGTCAAPSNDHKNGALWKPDGTPAFCQIMSMHWGVNEREKVECDGGACPDTRGECTGAFTFNGHEVVAEVRAFLAFPTHFFAECQAVNAYENMVPNPAWPYLDDAGRDGHFLTTTGVAPACNNNCSNSNYDCVPDGCGAGMDCCLPTPNTWQNMPGFEVASSPTSVKVLAPHIPYNQLDGEFGPVGGSEPAYNLSTFLNTQYKNNRQVTLLTGPNGPGNQDLWMTGYLDGCGDIILGPGGANRALGCEGKISYLGGHSFKTSVPVTSGGDMQGTRLFLNALFEAQCTVAPDSGGGTDSDGDGVDDGADSDPNDPNKCGDIDGDGCDDCSSGTFNLDADCGGGDAGNPASGSSEGCCDARTPGGARHLILALFVGGLVLRRRRRR